jgi:hypothetical protein
MRTSNCSSRHLGRRFYAITARVRELDLGQYPGCKVHVNKKQQRYMATRIHPSVVHAWVKCSVQRNVFPNLCSVRFGEAVLAEPGYFPFLQHCARSPLRKFHMGVRPEVVKNLLRTSAEVSSPPSGVSSVETLCLDARNDTNAEVRLQSPWPHLHPHEPLVMDDFFNYALASMPLLRSFSSLDLLSAETYLRLGSLSKLTSLRCSLQIDDVQLPHNAFPALKELCCFARHLSTLSKFLDAVSSTSVETIDFTWDVRTDSTTACDVEMLISQISLHPSRGVLSKLYLRFSGHFTAHKSIHSSDNILAVLHGMPCLRVVFMPVLDLVINEPRLEELLTALPTLFYIQFQKRPILSLHTLRLLGSRNGFYENPFPFTLRLHTELFNLEPGDLAPISSEVKCLSATEIAGDPDPQAMATVLVTLFPNLTILERRHHIDEDERWQDQHQRASKLNWAIFNVQEKRGML